MQHDSPLASLAKPPCELDFWVCYAVIFRRGVQQKVHKEENHKYDAQNASSYLS